MILFLSGCGTAPLSQQGSPSIGVFAMDTYMTVTVYDGNAEDALSQARSEIERLEKLWSVTDENSEIYALDHGGETAVSEETSELIRYAVEMYEKTGGALNIAMYPLLREWGFTTGEYTIPKPDTLASLLQYTDLKKIRFSGNTVTLPENMMIDVGALGKGETGDRITEILKRNGVTSALIDLGGNIRAVGKKPDGTDWRIALKSPFDSDNIAKLEVSDCNIITSGGYERYFTGNDGVVYWHILDPKTGSPAKSGLLSATVVGESGRMCDALSTSLFVMGEERAKELWRSMGGFEMVLITEDGRIIVTEGLRDKLTVYSQYSSMTVESAGSA